LQKSITNFCQTFFAISIQLVKTLTEKEEPFVSEDVEEEISWAISDIL